MADPYSTLGVAKTASDAEIKSAYRKLAKELHPDKNKDNPKASERFSDVTRAYDLLSDATKRAQFDRGEIRANPQAALLFHWKSLRRQVRIEGPLSEVSPAEADAYFHSRPRVSQLGSAASDQSRPLDDRQTYLDRVEELAERYPEGDIPRPAHWTGFRLEPEAIEFWIDRPNRLHERRRFTRTADGGWTSSLLYP